MNISKYFSHAFFNTRLFFVLLLGFSSGLPLALVTSTLQAWYTTAGVKILTIGFLGFVGQPYVYKFLWAPIMDRYEIAFLGRRRGWMLITQILLLLSICAMALVNPKLHPVALGGMALWVAFLSASQDINIDAYRTDLLKPEERGMGSAYAVTGYRVAMLVSGGLALILAGKTNWQVTYLVMGMLMFVGIVTTWFSPAPTYQSTPPESLSKATFEPLKELIFRQRGLLILLFIVLYKLSYEFILAMTPTFLLRDLGFSLVTVGSINKGIGFFALLIGIFMGGIALIRMRITSALLLFGTLQALGCLGYLVMALQGKNLILLVTTISLENLFAGMEAAAFVAFLMSLCNHRYTAMQFALLSALAMAGRLIAGPLGALIVMQHGWAELYFYSFIIAMPAIILLYCYRNQFQSLLQFKT